MALPTVTATGNLTDAPNIRFLANGIPVANMTIAANERKYNRDTNQWEDGATTFLDCTVWRAKAEACADRLQRGSTVTVTGKLKQESWEKDGQKRSKLVLEVEEIAEVIKAPSTGAAPAGQWGRDGNWDYGKPKQQPAADPWGASSAPAPF